MPGLLRAVRPFLREHEGGAKELRALVQTCVMFLLAQAASISDPRFSKWAICFKGSLPLKSEKSSCARSFHSLQEGYGAEFAGLTLEHRFQVSPLFAVGE